MPRQALYQFRYNNKYVILICQDYIFWCYKLEFSCSQENNLITAVIISAIITANAAEPATKRAF